MKAGGADKVGLPLPARFRRRGFSPPAAMKFDAGQRIIVVDNIH
jgi:hypothetical protein